jgi:hypothetical protein
LKFEWWLADGKIYRGLRFQPDSTQSLSVQADDVKYGSKFECIVAGRKQGKSFTIV